MRDKRQEIATALKQDGKPVLIYGAGKFAVHAANYLLANDIPVFGFWDMPEYYYKGKTIKAGQNKEEKIYKVYSEEEIDEILAFSKGGGKAYNVLLGRIDYSMLGQLRQKCLGCNIVEYLDGNPSRIMDMQFIEKNRELLQETYDLLSDNESRKVMEKYVLARLSGDVSPLSKLNSRKYLYDYELLNLEEQDIVVDAGSFDGDSIREMQQYINGRLSHVYAFEPDEATFGMLKRNMGNRDDIDCICAGLWKVNAILNFGGSGTMSSKLEDCETECKTKVYFLDQFLGDSKASLIKMDIEGAELDALAGAEKTITSVMPKLAICIYHKNEDLFSIPLYLKKITEKSQNKKYRFYFRKHSHSATETVCYAIPETIER